MVAISARVQWLAASMPLVDRSRSMIASATSDSGHRLWVGPLDGGAAHDPYVLAGRADALTVFADRLAVAGLVDADRSDPAVFFGHGVTADPAESIFHLFADLEGFLVGLCEFVLARPDAVTADDIQVHLCLLL